MGGRLAGFGRFPSGRVRTRLFPCSARVRKINLTRFPRDEFGMGTGYENGRGVQKNDEHAIKWYIKAANQKYSRAQTQLGDLDENGLGVSQDYKQARQWYEKAVAQGDATAMTNLGVLFAKVRVENRTNSWLSCCTKKPPKWAMPLPSSISRTLPARQGDLETA